MIAGDTISLSSGVGLDQVRESQEVFSLMKPLIPDQSTVIPLESNAEERRKEASLKAGDLESSILPDLSLDGSVLSLTDSVELDEIGRLFRHGAAYGLCCYWVLLYIVLRFCPADSYEAPHGLERNAHLLTFCLLVVTNGSRLLPLVFRSESISFMRSGVMVGTLTIQAIAISSNLLMSFVPTPVMVDPITGLRVHMVRWAEWVPLAFLMTFLTNNIDAPLRSPSSVTIRYPVAMALSTLAGLLFPFCYNWYAWLAVMILSWVLFMPCYMLLYERATAWRKLQKAVPLDGASATELELYKIVRSAFILSIACSTTWTALVVFYTVACLGRSLSPNGSWFASTSLNSIGMCAFEVASKIWYLSVLVDSYEKIFDEKVRAVRRLEELRHFMSAVWESSSDVIVFCAKRGDRVSARISPAFLKMIGLSTGRLSFLDRGDVSLVLEIMPDRGEFYVFAFDLSRPVTREIVESMKSSLEGKKRPLYEIDDLPVEERNVAVMAQLAVKACATKDAGTVNLVRDLVRVDEFGNEEVTLNEARVAKVEGGQSVLVVRDISDRVQRFEAEKKLVQELTTKEKDAETNKFSRHEIKNGILAAIALLDHIRETVDHNKAESISEVSLDPAIEHQTEGCNSHETESNQSGESNVDEAFSELESTLRDMLDTILDQAMAREIVYGEYKPRKERMNVPEVLSSLRRRASPRFPLKVNPKPLPEMEMDRQLLRYIYRNAVSNACKYGKLEGKVETILRYKHDSKIFEMEVINAPGDGHEELAQLSPEVVATVFHPGIQLSSTRMIAGKAAQLVRNESSGNGAWIMQKCAEALGGRCTIRFDADRTVFVFSCPVDAIVFDPHSLVPAAAFSIPSNTWGIVIDDSPIQRKLMDRFLRMAGIDDSHRKIFGKNADEVFSFCNVVAELMAENPCDRFILIADENLDIEDGGARHQTVSGSMCVQKLREQLDSGTESRLLALIRSANDSLSDIDLYKSRAHGFLLKEPIQSGKVLDVIRPWWVQRFPQSARRASVPFTSTGRNEEHYGPSPEDIRHSLDTINALVSVTDETVLEKRWRTVKEKLHALKGDLKTMETKEPLANVLNRIDRLIDFRTLPESFIDQWQNVKSQVESTL